MSPSTTASQAGEQFAALPLHDATLRELRLDWLQHLCIANVLAVGSPAVEHQIIWHGVSEALIPHRAPWGESVSINAVRVEAGNAFVVEMQSGDEIRIIAERVEFR